MLRGIRPLRLLRPLSFSAIHVSPLYTAVVRVHVDDVVTLQGYRHGSPSSSPSSTSAEPRSIHARFSSREHRVLPRYLRPSPSSFILSGRVGGSGENLGAISICRLLCLVLSFSPPFSLSVSFTLESYSSSFRSSRSFSFAIVDSSSLSPIRYRKPASGTLSRGSMSKR